jgi:hypothetical protein
MGKNPINELIDGRWLIASWLILGMKLKVWHISIL